MAAWTCARCATRLHDECFELAGACPTLGCVSRALLLKRRAREPGASGRHLALWLAASSGLVFGIAAVLPRVFYVFEKKKRSLPPTGMVLQRRVHFVDSPLGLVTLGARRRRRGRARPLPRP